MRAIVIGAGVAGLATAILLAEEGYQVTVVEKNQEVGGRAGSLQVGEYRFETGPSWYLMPDAFEHFYALLGTTPDHPLTRLDPAYRLFPEGQAPLDVSSDREEMCALFESIEEGAGEKLANYLDSAADTYRIAIERFLYTNFTNLGPFLSLEVLKRWRTLARLLTSSLERFVATQFQDVRLRQMLSYPAVFLSSRPEATPALYHLMSHTDLTQGVAYPARGFTGVVESLHRHATERGVRFRLGTAATRILSEDGTVSGVAVRGPEGEEVLPAELVVSGADLEHTEQALLPAELQSYSPRYFARRDPGVGTVLVLAGVRGELPQLTHHNLFFSKDWRPDFEAVFDGPTPLRPLDASRSLYVCKASASDATLAPAGCENLFILVPVPAKEHIGRGDAYGGEASPKVQAIARQALEQLSEWAEIPDLESRVEVLRTIGPADFSERYHAFSGGAIGPAHTLRQSAFLRGSNKSKKVEGLYYAGGTTVPGVGVPLCLISAENVIKRLRGDGSPGPLPTP